MSTEFISTNIIHNLIKVMSIATENSLHKESAMEDLNGSIRYFTGCEFPFFNGVFNNHGSDESVLIDNLDKTTQFFTTQSTPFIWWWTQQSEVPAKIKANLDAKGFQFLGDFLGIAANLNEIKFDKLGDRIEIGTVNSDKEYKLFFDILCEVFQMSESIKSDLQAMYNSYGIHGKFKHYLGFYAGEPVATLTSYIDGSVIGLYNGATLVKFQKHGLCSALAQYAITEARSFNCQYAVSQLMTPGMAKGISEKMGFQTYCRLLPFLKDPRG
ncbi:hypothetical protein [Legionella drozanskii]|uniref:N-acetyltransferase domain-containing protein n=1 Tax=Legionella drozanskii LLAP-1 TaxID=1212489 RepID=A0A0W0T888_9GAMM|nr:hypothetical protein [Legionella drozanskii]KTC91820.1 hypothetical protein Ldro_0654 [Legionella drozanskii LLAP-1]